MLTAYIRLCRFSASGKNISKENFNSVWNFDFSSSNYSDIFVIVKFIGEALGYYNLTIRFG